MLLSLASQHSRVTSSGPSEEHFEKLYREHFPVVWRVLRRMGVQDASMDDAAQDVFVVFFNKWGEFDQSRPARSWLCGIAVRVASQYRKKSAVHASSYVSLDPPGERRSPSEEAELSQAVALMHGLLSSLGEKQRAVFVLAEFEQFRAPEIAELLGESVNTVYSRLRLGRKKFEEALKRQRLREPSHGGIR